MDPAIPSVFAICFQLKVIAFDSIYPDNQATGTVSIKVERNPNTPAFPTAAYAVTVDEKLPLGASVIKVRATDSDKVGVQVSRISNVHTSTRIFILLLFYLPWLWKQQ